jgi:hypothetical protein
LFAAGEAFILGQGPVSLAKREAAGFFGYFFDLKQKSNRKPLNNKHTFTLQSVDRLNPLFFVPSKEMAKGVMGCFF